VLMLAGKEVLRAVAVVLPEQRVVLLTQQQGMQLLEVLVAAPCLVPVEAVRALRAAAVRVRYTAVAVAEVLAVSAAQGQRALFL